MERPPDRLGAPDHAHNAVKSSTSHVHCTLYSSTLDSCFAHYVPFKNVSRERKRRRHHLNLLFAAPNPLTDGIQL